jgi:hypothetical protein
MQQLAFLLKSSQNASQNAEPRAKDDGTLARLSAGNSSAYVLLLSAGVKQAACKHSNAAGNAVWRLDQSLCHLPV